MSICKKASRVLLSCPLNVVQVLSVIETAGIVDKGADTEDHGAEGMGGGDISDGILAGGVHISGRFSDGSDADDCQEEFGGHRLVELGVQCSEQGRGGHQ